MGLNFLLTDSDDEDELMSDVEEDVLGDSRGVAIDELSKGDDAEVVSWWSVIREAVVSIQQARRAKDGATREDLFRCVESFLTTKSPMELYHRLKVLMKNYILGIHEQLLSSSSDRLVFLKEVNACWIQYCDQMKMICNIFLSLDRGYVLQNAQVLSIWDLGLDFYREHIVKETIVENRVIEGLLMQIEKERAGEAIDRSLVSSLLRMLTSLKLYETVFQDKFLKTSEELYSREGTRLLMDMNVPDYLRHVTARLEEENNRLLHYLDNTNTRPLLMHLVVKQLLGEHKTTIIQKGLDDMLRENRKDHLVMLYDLMGKVKGGLALLCTHFGTYIKSHGKTIVCVPEKDKYMVQDLLNFKDKLDTMVKECCKQNTKFSQTIKESFESFINTRQNKPAELIAKYVDGKLRSGNKEATEDELERLLDKIMVLFRFINGKDVFEAFYKRDLSKRLLLSKSASVDAEKSMLSKLKAECGPNFTGKLEGMFKDMELSKDFMLSFKQYYQNLDRDSASSNIELTVSILTQGFWPSYPDTALVMPNEMLNYQKIFTEFYLSKHSGRKLMFQSTLGHCVLKACFPSGAKELQVSLFQTLILLLFNDGDVKTYAEIKAGTNIEVFNW